MTRSMTLFALPLLALGNGCGSSAKQQAAAETPLTLVAWKALPPETKFEIGTLERLKQGEPKLREAPAWNKFTRETLLPAKRREMPAAAAKS